MSDRPKGWKVELVETLTRNPWFGVLLQKVTQPDGSKIHGLRFALAYSRDGEHVTFTKLGGNAQCPRRQLRSHAHLGNPERPNFDVA